MAESDVTAYIEAQAEPKRSTLLAVREAILSVEPNLEQVIAWNSPQFKFNGKYALGICAFTKHLTFSPQSPEVMTAHAEQLVDYVTSKSSFQFAIDTPLPIELVRSLVLARLEELR